jgi:hypothetical protein
MLLFLAPPRNTPEFHAAWPVLIGMIGPHGSHQWNIVRVKSTDHVCANAAKNGYVKGRKRC